MNGSVSDSTWLGFICQAALLITGGLLLVAASVLFASLMIADHPGPGLTITALLNAAIFYLWGLGCIRYVYKTWTSAAAQLGSSLKPATPTAP